MKTRKRILIATLALTSTFAFAQKKELRKAERAVKTEKFYDALDHLEDAEGQLGAADEEMKIDYYKLLGDASLGAAASSNFAMAKQAAEAYGKAIDLNPDLKKSIQKSIADIRFIARNSAVEDQENGKFKEAAEKMKVIYNLGEDQSDLYFQGMFLVGAKEYSEALKIFEKLMDSGYTGVETEFVATDKETGEVVAFANQQQRDFSVKTGEFVAPTTRKTPSRKGEILRYVTLIHRQEGNDDRAREILRSARAENPDDIDLIMIDAEYNYEQGNHAKYNELMKTVIASDPDNPELYFNLGARSQEIGDKDQALKYYEKAIELKPEYESALINLAVLKLSYEQPLVEEMNNLGMSAADNKRYEELKTERENLYKETLPLLEKVLKINPKNVEVLETLANIYGQLGNDAKREEMKSKLQALGAE